MPHHGRAFGPDAPPRRLVLQAAPSEDREQMAGESEMIKVHACPPLARVLLLLALDLRQ
jgi:hypothetical protein